MLQIGQAELDGLKTVIKLKKGPKTSPVERLVNLIKADPHAKKYLPIVNADGAPRAAVRFIEFFARPEVPRRMIESEEYHLRPALAGVVLELDKLIHEVIEDQLLNPEPVSDVLPKLVTHTRRNQVIGVIVKVIMNSHGYYATGEKGSLVGLSDFIRRSEHYKKKKAID